MNIQQEKRALREELKYQNAVLPKSYTEQADKRICESVIRTAEYQKAKTVFCFVGRTYEIDTYPIIEDALQSGKRLCVPKCVDKGIMEARRIMSSDDLAKAKYGLLEPGLSCALILPAEIEFAVIPCVTCNYTGYRLGTGGGYYDRYLEGADFFTCMICREKLIREIIPQGDKDVIPLMLITETGVFKTVNAT